MNMSLSRLTFAGLRHIASGALATCLAIGVLAAPARAQDRNFQRVFTANLPGQLITIGNSVVTCDRTQNTAAQCDAVETGVGPPTLDNDTITTAFIDIDGVASTFNSSAASLPIGGEVEWAGLYWWGALHTPNNAPPGIDPALRNRVVFQVPGAEYQPVTANWLEAGVITQPYLAFADVTALVKAAGAGVYQVGNVVTTPGVDDHLGGWSLVVVNRNPDLPFRHISIYDGYKTYGGGNAVNVTFEEFLTPLQGPLDAQVTFIALDGDAGKTDSVTFNGQPLTNALNPLQDFGNSTISRSGLPFTTRNPAYSNTLGSDIDSFDVSGLLMNSARSAVATFSGVAAELNFATLIGFQTTLYSPEVTALKTSLDVNGGVTRPGDQLEYTITVGNEAQALDTAVKVVLNDPIPPNTTYVPGSLQIVSGVPLGAPAGVLTDAAGDDTGEFNAGTNSVVVRLGAAAGVAEGGSLLPGQTTTIKFRVTIDSNLTTDTLISNQATISFQGLTLSQTSSSAVISVTSSSPGGGPTTDPVNLVDTDADGLPDVVEGVIRTDPNDADSDDDGLIDGQEPDFDKDTDADGAINALDPDSDNDGLFDGTEAGKDCANPATNAAVGKCIADADATSTTSPIRADTDAGSVADGLEDVNKNGRVDTGERNPNDPADDVPVVDTDSDGLPDPFEVGIGTNPNDADTDNDGLIDGQEPQFDKDTDGDGLINALDPDSDNDGIFDGTESGKDCSNAATDRTQGVCVPDADMGATKTDPLKGDTDAGGKPDGAEDINRNGRIDAPETNPNDPADDNVKVDTDSDGLTDEAEKGIGSNPMDADTDDDGLIDGQEANPTADTDGDGLINILDPDSDNDGLFDGTEAGKDCSNAATNKSFNRCVADADMGATKTSPVSRDTDRGGKPDGAEDVNRNGRIDAGETDPNNPADDNPRVDTDSDGLTDEQEGGLGSKPNDADTDDDGLIDGLEPNPADDTDGDGTKNILDADSDGDGLFDGTEAGKDCSNAATDATKNACVADADPGTVTSVVNRDTDRGGVPDGVEDKNRNGKLDAGEGDPLDPRDDVLLFPDTDADGLSDDEEKMIDSDPNDADTDDDGVIDGQEQGPTRDPDGDGVKNVRDTDSDNDGLLDGTELGKDCNHPATNAAKGLCIADADMGVTTTNPEIADTDGGSVGDGIEDVNKNGRVDAGERNPLNAADDIGPTPGMMPPTPQPTLVEGLIGGGGCNCAFSPGQAPAGGPLALLALGAFVALSITRRRRR